MNLQLFVLVIYSCFLIASSLPSDSEAIIMALPNCTSKCGKVIIPYPFGIGKGCYYDDWYEITCNNTKKPFLRKYNLEVMQLNINDERYDFGSSLTIESPVASNCPAQKGNTIWSSTNFSGSPYYFIGISNSFTVMGCANALLLGNAQEIMAGCTSSCKSNTTTTGCYGINCCQTSIPSSSEMSFYTISIEESTGTGCTRAFMGIDDGSTSVNYSSPSVINSVEHVPLVMGWSVIYSNTTEMSIFSSDYCRFSDDGYVDCSCKWNQRGNPYIPNGCKTVEQCAKCEKDCRVRYVGPKDGEKFYCKRNKEKELILGSSFGGGLFFLLLCGFCFWMYKVIKKRRIVKLKKKFFKRNGGLLLEQQISSDEGAVKKTILFTSNDLEKATDNYNENRILGQGGQGTVYKGMLADGQITAVKKSKIVDESQLEQFINEVVILSQINHRNIVKLLGCCLETEVPLLVYEFVPNGNLSEIIHDENQEFPLSWKMRLQIATQVAGALAYLHSASSSPIYHRDIKSTNILLDEKFRAKVSDFGTSRSIAIEQTHLTTIVSGTFGYLDPEYFQSGQFTEKSDVYSFGVVLIELLTGQKSISIFKSEEDRSLATRFISCVEQMRPFDILDASILAEATKEEILAISDIARRCLDLNGKKRPTMKQVMVDLECLHLLPSVSDKDTFNIEN